MTANKPEAGIVNEDKMREEFEAWWRREYENTLYCESAWRGWKASRDTLVVGLPTQCKEGDDYAEGWNNALGWSKAAIEAAGVRVKP